MSMRQLIQSLPDIVRDSRLDTEIFGSYTQHIVYVSGSSARERHVRKEERWVRDRFLGQGAYGTVHLERSEQKDGVTRLRAVKQIKKFSVAGKELEYMRELEAISKFSHSRYSHCFVRSDGWFDNADSVFITMEYLEKGDLHKYLTKPLPEFEVRIITSQVLEGLKYMHDNGFVHRDLKPGNIMVVNTGPEWFVKIADFGISKRRQQDVTSLHTLQMGTLGFAAPETMGLRMDNQSRSYTAAVDLWSLGACVYMMLMNDLPFLSLAELFQYVNGMLGFPTGSLQSKSVTGQVQQFIVALMSPDPMSRPSSEMATKHPWITTSLPAHLAEIKPGDTMLSTASAAWSSMAEQVGQQTKKHIGEPAEDKTLVRLEEPENTFISSIYRPPYIDTCDDEHDEANGGRLPPNCPYVLDDADIPVPIISNDPQSHIPPSSPRQNDESTARPSKKLLNLPLNTSEELLTPNMISRPRSPYFLQVGEKMDISNMLPRGRSKSTTENESGFKTAHADALRRRSQHYRSISVGETPLSPTTIVPPTAEVKVISNDSRISNKHKANKMMRNMDNKDNVDGPSHSKAMILYTGERSKGEKKRKWDDVAEVDYEALQRGLLFAQGSRYIPCAYCASQYHIFGEIRLVPCGHWICHCCLMERFALVLVSPDYVLQCCDKDIHLTSFDRILIDPRINGLWSIRHHRLHTKGRYIKDFVKYLNTKCVFKDLAIKAEISAATGVVFPVYVYSDRLKQYTWAPPARHSEAIKPDSEQYSAPIHNSQSQSRPRSRSISPRWRHIRAEPYEYVSPEDYYSRPRQPTERGRSYATEPPEARRQYTKKYYTPTSPTVKVPYNSEQIYTNPFPKVKSSKIYEEVPPQRQSTNLPRRTFYEEISEDGDSGSDSPMVEIVERYLTSNKHREIDVVGHNGGNAGCRLRYGMPYADVCSWLNEVYPEGAPDAPLGGPDLDTACNPHRCIKYLNIYFYLS
ncbi:kinase-like domain-containing protein [Annulohypoxylon moriforme]|nr:kinase-like domain-containing protein [Annulohypoxylon moriforme]